METIQEKAKLADERIQQLKSLIATIGTRQLDPEVYINVLQEENTQLKERVQNLVDELVTLENQRGVTQQYDFVNKVPKAPTQSVAQPEKPVEVQQPVAKAAPVAAAAAVASNDQQDAKDKKEKKKKATKEEKPAKAAANTAIDITRFDLRIGKIVSVEKHPDADSLYVEKIDVGEEKPRTVCSGLVKHLQIGDLDQKLVVVLCNLKPAKMRGITSEAMVMCASTPDKVEILEPPSNSKLGDRIECEGYDCSSPDAQIKKELSDQILPDMTTNDKGEATFKGVLWKVGFGDFGAYSSSDPFTSNQSTSSPINSDPDVDWSVFENAERYLLRDDSAWITRLSKDFWWNLERISEMITSDYTPVQQINNNGTFNRPPLPTQKFQQQQQQQQQFMQSAVPTKIYSQQQQVPPPMQFTGVPPRKIVGQRTQQQQLSTNNAYRNNSMFNNGFTSPPPSSSSSSSSSGSTIVRPIHNNNNNNNFMNSNINIPDKSNFFQAFSSMSIAGGNHDQDMEYNPFQSKISFDNNMWGNNSQQPIPWQ
ncbi:unnamed protein product [Rotaria sp. Silwood2]|nr:unnamed protein product [Rotaria sp. Silwood2]CAF4278729.1 unnamed protein product [Rotaria sp. Silwood2]